MGGVAPGSDRASLALILPWLDNTFELYIQDSLKIAGSFASIRELNDDNQISTMRSKAAPVQRIADPALRDSVYLQRKNALFRRAMELCVMCDAEVAIIMFGPDGELAQFSSSSMESTLRQYSRSCTEPHESHTPSGMRKRVADHRSKSRGGGGNESGATTGPASKRRRDLALSDDGDGTDTAEAILNMRNLPPLGPKGKPDEHIDREFDRLMEERAKRAQQGSGALMNGGSSDLADIALAAALGSMGPVLDEEPAAKPPTAAPVAELKPPTSAPATGANGAAVASAGGPNLSIDSLAAVLAGNLMDSSVPGVKPESTGGLQTAGGSGGGEGGDDCVSPTGPRPPVTIETPAVTVTPPVAGSAEASGLLGPQQGVSAQGQPLPMEAAGVPGTVQ